MIDSHAYENNGFDKHQCCQSSSSSMTNHLTSFRQCNFHLGDKTASCGSQQPTVVATAGGRYFQIAVKPVVVVAAAAGSGCHQPFSAVAVS